MVGSNVLSDTGGDTIRSEVVGDIDGDRV